MDWSTIRWAYAMDRRNRRKVLVVSTKSSVKVGPVNEISLTHVKVGTTRIPRDEITQVRPNLNRSHIVDWSQQPTSTQEG